MFDNNQNTQNTNIMEEIDELTTDHSDTIHLSSRGGRTISQRMDENKPVKTKKKKTASTAFVSEIWNIFDKDKPVILKEDPVEVVNHELCSNCKSVLVIMDDGFPTCTNTQCGIICKDILDHRPEWRFHSSEDKNSADPARCGNPINPLLEESSHGCKVLYTGKSSYEMRRIAKWTEWQSIPHKEKSLYNEFMYISTMAQNAGISKIFIDHALIIHKSISEQQMFRGCNRDGTKAASIYISCKVNGCPRTSHEIAKIFQLDKTSATHGCSLAMEILNNIDRNNGIEEATDSLITKPSHFIARFCSSLGISGKHVLLSLFIANKIDELRIIQDNAPHSIAAGVVYFVCQLFDINVSKTDIKHACGVSEVTINKCYKKIDLEKAILVPPILMSM